MAVAMMCGCCCCDKEYKMGTYGYDLAFFTRHEISTVELESVDGRSRLLIVPAYQGRVMTSTADGLDGKSYGWINYKFIEAGKVSPQFNPLEGRNDSGSVRKEGLSRITSKGETSRFTRTGKFRLRLTRTPMTLRNNRDRMWCSSRTSM